MKPTPADQTRNGAAGRTVEVFPLLLDGSASREDRALLSAAELSRASRRGGQGAGGDFATVRAHLRRRLGAALNLPPAAVPLTDVPGRGPVLDPSIARPDDGTRLAFSVSHTDGLGLVALCRGAPIGVDVERLTPVDPDLWSTILSVRERAEIARLPQAERGRAALRAWTRKEALLKGIGVGLQRDPATLDVSLAPRIDNDAAQGVEHGWRLFSLDVGPDWDATVAARTAGAPVTIRLHPRITPLQSPPFADS